MQRFLAGALALTTVAGAAFTASTAAAQPKHDQREIRQDRRELRDDRRDLRQDQRAAARHWRQGQRLDRRYGAWQDVDWRAHRLPAPRRGYHWVRSGDDYVLAALTGGLIASVIAANQ